jgi:hypothetical protein
VIEAVGGGGSGVFAVVPGELTAAADHAQYAADAIGRIPGQVHGALADAAAFGGLEIGRAVGEVIAAWEQAIGDRAAAVRDVADRLRSTAGSYASVEDGVTSAVTRAHRALF